MSSNKPKLYFFIGYPGAGKTTLSKKIADTTGAVHIWADDKRHKYFPEATHSQDESVKLYKMLNNQAEELLRSGSSVVFDTNFNFYDDRKVMRDIAANSGAEAVLIWIDIPQDQAKDRAVCDEVTRNGYTVSMTSEQFDKISSKLEPPKDHEKYFRIDSANPDYNIVLRDLDRYS